MLEEKKRPDSYCPDLGFWKGFNISTDFGGRLLLTFAFERCSAAFSMNLSMSTKATLSSVHCLRRRC
jgi:hypothetical protein